ncbi:hypothetical protein EC957_001131 [Mortierella hygrophila]|uniref:Uncharacterized protein n=1 Tax=Mortierella hygrophila TaxID=979708 RepID=A0A9P6FGD1_9FUNG|nr:hypothetical protein EC957_001131 [Mortierella hygrophila]
MVTLSTVEVILTIFGVLTCLLIISIWIRQAKEGRQHYPLSFMFIWLLLVALLTSLSQLLLGPSSFDPLLPTYPIDPTHTTLSGLTAIRSISTTPNNFSRIQTCVLFAHFEEVLWLGVGMSLLRWTCYLYGSLRRKLGVVSPRLMEAVAEHDPVAVRMGSRGYGGGGGGGGVEVDMTAGYSFTRRSIKSFADVWGMMPVFIVVPVAIIWLVIKTCIRSICCGCCLSGKGSKAPISDQNRTVMEEEIQRKMKAKKVEDVFEAWPKWPKYMDDDPLANQNQNQVAAEPSHELTEIRVQSPLPDVGSSPSRPTSGSIVSEHPTLATKLRVTRLDLNDTHEESYGYDITKQRIRYHRDSWSHKTKVMMAVHQRLIGDIFFCIAIPALAFIPLYILPARDRTYDVYPYRGGCRVTSNHGQADWIRMVVLLTLNTVIAIFGLLFAILSIFQFKKQNGALSFKMKSLTPSPAVLRLYKSTEIVKNILLFCVGLNTILTLGRIIYLGLAMSAYKRLTTNGTSPEPQRLFRTAEHDPDMTLVILAILLVVVTYLKTFWRYLFCCFRNTSSEDDNESAHANSASFPNYPKPLKSISKGKHHQQHQQRPLVPIRYLAQITSTTTTSTSRTSVGPGDSEMTKLERYPGSRVGIVEPSMVISIGSECRVTDLNEDLEGEFALPSGSLHSCQLSPTKAKSGHVTMELPTISKPDQAAHPEEGRSIDSPTTTTTTTTTWLSSAPIKADGALTAIPSTSTFPSSTLTSTATTLVSYPLSTASLTPKFSKSTLRNLSSMELLAYTQGPLPTIPDQVFPATRVKRQSCNVGYATSSRISPAATAATENDLDFNYDCELGSNLDDLDEDNYDMETMGAISLEELVFDEPSTDYESMHQTMMIPSDDRAMLENIVHHVLMASIPPFVPSHHRTTTTTTSVQSNKSRRSTSRGRISGRRPSVIQYSNSPYGHGHISRASSGRSSRRSDDTRHPHHHPLKGAYFHLVSKGINVVDLYADADDDESVGTGSTTGHDFATTATTGRPRAYHHRKKSSTSSTLYFASFQPHPYGHAHSYQLRGLGGKGKCPNASGDSVGAPTILENESPRPDSPTDPRDSSPLLLFF